MIRKALILFLMVPLLAGAMASGVPFPVLVLMGSLILIAVVQSARRDEQLDQRDNGG